MNQTKDKIYLPHTAGLLATAAALGQTQLTSVAAPAAAVAFAGVTRVHVQAFVVVAIPISVAFLRATLIFKLSKSFPGKMAL